MEMQIGVTAFSYLPSAHFSRRRAREFIFPHGRFPSQQTQASFPRRERLEPYFQCVPGGETFERLARTEMLYWREKNIF